MCFSRIYPSATDGHHTTQKPLVSLIHNDPPRTSSIKHPSVKSDENTLKISPQLSASEGSAASAMNA